MTELRYLPPAEFSRLAALELDPLRRAALFATCARLNALYMIARAGSGHIGSSFSCLDIVSWLFLEELTLPDDIYFSSKGHDVPALYAVLIARGLLPAEKLHALRRLGGLPGHPDVSIPHMHVNSGSLGMGISKAKGLARARRLRGRPGRVYVLTGDGELQEGQLWESLASAVNHGLGELTVIVDHNKIQSDTFVAQVSDLGDLEAKFRAFGWHTQRVDGHDLAALRAALAAAREDARPSVVVADTIKGRGVSFMEHTAMGPDETLYRFHSGAPAPEDYARALAELQGRADALLGEAGAEPLALEVVAREVPAAPATEPQRLVGAYGEALLEEAARDERIVALDADLILDTGLIPFAERFPARFVECGIAEQDMVSQAGGLALGGLLPVAHSFACFLSARPNEQIYTNASEGTRVVYVGSLAGLVPGGPGHSHQCVRDIAALGAMPGMTLLEPSCAAEVPLALAHCLHRAPGPSYLRLVSIPCEIPYVLPADYTLEEGRGVLLREGGDALLIGYGPVLLPQAWQAAEALAAEGIELAIANLPWLNRIDPTWLREALGARRLLVTLDNHYLRGGQGELIRSALVELGLERLPRVRSLGLRELPACGTNPEVLRHHELDAEGIAGAVREALA